MSVWDWAKGAVSDVGGWLGGAADTIMGQSDFNADAPMLERGGQYGIDDAAARQKGFSSYLDAAARGQGPTAAQAQFQRQSEMAQRQARGMAAGNTGGNAGLAIRASADAGAMGRGAAASDAAMLRAKEQQAAMGLQAQNLAQQRQQALQESAANQSSILTNQGYKYGMAAGNAQRGQQGIGSLASAGGAMLLMSDERAKTDIVSTSEPSLMDRIKASASRIYEGTKGAYEAEAARNALPDGSDRHFAVETPEEQARYANGVAWAQLQQMADAQKARSDEAGRMGDRAHATGGTMMGLDVPQAPTRKEARDAYRNIGEKPPHGGASEREKTMAEGYGEILKQFGQQMQGGGDAMGGITPYQGSTVGGGGVNYFQGGQSYNPLSDIRAKTDVAPTGDGGEFARQHAGPELDALQRDLAAQRGGGAPPVQGGGDFAQQHAGPELAQLYEMLRAYGQDQAKKEGERRALADLDRVGQEAAPPPPPPGYQGQAYGVLPPTARFADVPPAPSPYSKFPDGAYRGGY